MLLQLSWMCEEQEANDGLATMSLNDEPLTLAKLYVSNQDGTWVEIDTGEVHMVSKSLSGDNEETYLGEGGASLLHLVVNAVGSNDCLLRTSIAKTGVYNTHELTTLLWFDDELGRDIALSFNSEEGLNQIAGEIRRFQMISDTDASPYSAAAAWEVRLENLPSILEAARGDQSNFSSYVSASAQYWSQLADLFRRSIENNDEATANLLSEIALALLRSPYTSDTSILAQVVDGVNDCIDMVQYGIGRRDKESGFVSAEERRASFRNPCGLEDGLLERIHIIFACNYLRDLLPLSLEDVDQFTQSPLVANLEIVQENLIDQILSSGTLHRVFGEHMRQMSVLPCDLVHFVLELSKLIKGARSPMEVKASRYSQLFEAGLLQFFTCVLACGVSQMEGNNEEENVPAEECRGLSRIIQAICEILTHSGTFAPQTTNILAAEASDEPERCTLRLLMRFVLALPSHAVQHAILEFVSSIVQSLDESTRQKIIFFWVGTGETSPIHSVIAHVAKLIHDIVEEKEVWSVFAGQELIATYSLKIVKLIVEASYQSSFMQLWCHLTDTQLFTSFSRFIRIASLRYANLQSSVVSFVSVIVRYGEAKLVAQLCAASSILEAAVETYLSGCRRNNILSASLASLLAGVASAAKDCTHHMESDAFQRYSDSFIASGFGGGSQSRLGHQEEEKEDNPYRELLSRFLRKYGSQLEASEKTIHDRMKAALASTADDTDFDLSCSGYSSSEASSLDRFSCSPDVSPVKKLASEISGEGLPERALGQKSQENHEEQRADEGCATKKIRVEDEADC